jgi:hypothetical protein
MQELIIYFLKASGLLVAFYLSYHLLLRKETFFTSNRWFLLFGLVASALLPLLFFKKIVYIERPKISLDDLISMSNHSEVLPIKTIAPTLETIDWFQVVTFGYSIVALLLLVRVIVNIYSISRLLKNKVVQKENSFSLIDLKEEITPFSFFKYIVFNSSLYSPKELESILLHEKVHSKQKHSFDVLLAHLFTIVFWINPVVWFYKKAIIQNLEFIADSKAIQHIEDKKAYQKVLLKVVSHQNCLTITNHFYQSLIKKRIVMLNKNQSNKRNSWKYALVLPLLGAFVIFFQMKVVAQEKESKKQEITNKETPFFIVIDKSTSEKDIKEYSTIVKSNYDGNLKFSKIKRNSNGEIIGIKVGFKQKDGRSGATEISGTKPIKTFYFIIKGDEMGFDEMGFERLKKSKNNGNATVSKYPITDSTVETSNALKSVKITDKDIYIDGVKATNDEFSQLVPNTIDKVEVNTFENSFKITTKTINISADNFEVKTISKEKPLIILNGKRTLTTLEDLNKLDPNLIQSMNVLKGKNAIEKYGKDGENGAIEISTKENVDLLKSSSKNEQDRKEEVQSRKNEIQVRKDKIQSRKDEVQARKDEVQARKDNLQAKIDAKKALKDAEQAKKDAIQAKKDLEQAKKK